MFHLLPEESKSTVVKEVPSAAGVREPGYNPILFQFFIGLFENWEPANLKLLGVVAP